MKFTEELASEIYDKVKNMSFEDGRKFILSLYPNIIEHTNTDYNVPWKKDGIEGIYDCDFKLKEDDEIFISFSTKCIYRENEEEIIEYNLGKWVRWNLSPLRSILNKEVKNEI